MPYAEKGPMGPTHNELFQPCDCLNMQCDTQQYHMKMLLGSCLEAWDTWVYFWVPVWKPWTHICCLRPDMKCLRRRPRSLHSDRHSQHRSRRSQRTAQGCTLGLSCSLAPPLVAVLMGPKGDTCPVACTYTLTDQTWGLLLQSFSSGTAAVLPDLRGDASLVACTCIQTGGARAL
jgi:hypothetical protein